MKNGGKRPGAGRKKGLKNKILLRLEGPERDCISDYLLRVAKNTKLRHKTRLEACRILMPYCYRKMPEGREHSGPNGAPLALVVDTHLVAAPTGAPVATKN